MKDLELTPTATLVLVPGKMAQSSAYPSMGLPSPWGIVGAVSSTVGSVLATGIQTVQSFVATATQGGGDGQQQQQVGGQHQGGRSSGARGTSQRGPGTPSIRGGGGTSSRIRTLHDGNEGDSESGRSGGTRFYNGNQVGLLL